MRRLGILLLSIGMLVTAACGSTSPPLFTVAELVPRIDELNGKTVRVAGYLGVCAGYGCDLYPSKDDQARWELAYAELRKSRKWVLPDLPVLGIGSGEEMEFDSKAAPYNDRYVIITGMVTNQCRYKGERGCTDRSPDLEPMSIAAWSGPVPPPPQMKSAKA